MCNEEVKSLANFGSVFVDIQADQNPSLGDYGVQSVQENLGLLGWLTRTSAFASVSDWRVINDVVYLPFPYTQA